MEVLFYRYRKVLFAMSIFMLFYFCYEVYEGLEKISSNGKGEGMGTLVDAGMSLFVSVYLFVNVRKAVKAFKEENAAAESENGAAE